MQAHWRGYSQWKKYNERLKYFRDNVDFIIKVKTLLLFGSMKLFVKLSISLELVQIVLMR